MTVGAGLRDREVIAAQVAALRGDATRLAGEFECGALAALCWLLEGGPGPVTGEVGSRPGTARAILSLSIDLVRWFTPRGSHSAEEIARLHADLAVRMTAPQGD